MESPGWKDASFGQPNIGTRPWKVSSKGGGWLNFLGIRAEDSGDRKNTWSWILIVIHSPNIRISLTTKRSVGGVPSDPRVCIVFKTSDGRPDPVAGLTGSGPSPRRATDQKALATIARKLAARSFLFEEVSSWSIRMNIIASSSRAGSRRAGCSMICKTQISPALSFLISTVAGRQVTVTT